MNVVPFHIEFAASVKAHLTALTGQQRRRELDAIERHLAEQPITETRNRKPLRPNPLAPWELRIGELPVIYDVVAEPTPVVYVLAVGVKKGNVLRIAGKEIAL